MAEYSQWQSWLNNLSFLEFLFFLNIQFSSIQLCTTLRPHESQHARPPCPSPTPGVHSHSTSIKSVMPSSHLILCRLLLLRLQSLPASVFSNEPTLRMRWPNYWSFSFSIIPSKEIPGLIRPTKERWSNCICLLQRLTALFV